MTRKLAPSCSPTSYTGQMWACSSADGSSLALEALAGSGVGDVRRHHLDGDRPVQAGIQRPVHRAHAAGAHRRLDEMRAEPRARRE
jgi:hypothetical protein